MGKPVTVHIGTGGSFLLKEGESLLEALVQNGHGIPAPCGGLGRCGKCRVKVIRGNLAITGQDEKVFSQAALAEGWRLACRAFPGEDLEILLPEDIDRDFEILSADADGRSRIPTGYQVPQEAGIPAGIPQGFRDTGCPGKKTAESGQNQEYPGQDTGYCVAVDLGTTTIAMALLKEHRAEPLHTVSFVNSQRQYGADVISRIQASVDGKQDVLQKCVRVGLQEGLVRLATEAGISSSWIRKVVVSGNTTMGHLLLGYPCQGLGVYPFTPVNLDFVKGGFRELTWGNATGAEEGIRSAGAEDKAENVEEADPAMVVLPGISTFVGGDIVSGLYAADFDRKEGICLLVDLGTNGEMALGNRDKILVASAAAGPAFEGGNLTWGTGSVAGAICSVRLEGEGKARITTIRNAPPIGICGTGVVETVRELVRTGIVDETGMLQETYFEEGYPLARTPDGRQIVCTGQDIREIQLAKAAIRAGIETLLVHYGITASDVQEVYLAGGFGHKLDPEAAVAIGMLPRELLGRIQGVGNSSLAGAMKFLQEGNGRERMEGIRRISREIGLAADKDFQAFYVDAMFF